MTEKEISLLLPDYDTNATRLECTFYADKAMHAVNFLPLFLKHHKVK